MQKHRLAAAVTIFVLVAAACGGGADDGPDEGDLKLGAVLPLSGALSFFGPAMSTGVELAVDVFNEAAEAAGYDLNVTLEVEDSQTDPAAATEAARKLVDSDGVHAIVGAAASGVTIPVAESVTIPGRIAQCSPSATSNEITTLSDDGFVNRVAPADEHQAPLLAQLVVDALGAGATVNVGARDDEYGRFLAEGVANELEDRGLSIGSTTFWNPEGTAFDSEAAEVVDGEPDGWVLIDFPGTWKSMSAALVRTGDWDPAHTFTADGLKAGQLPGDSGIEATEGMTGTAPGGREGFSEFWAAHLEDAPRGPYDAQSYDCAMLLMLAAVAAGSTDSPAIRDELQGVSGPGGDKFGFDEIEEAIAALADGQDIDYEGASGPIDLDANGDPSQTGVAYEIFTFTDGQLEVVRTEILE